MKKLLIMLVASGGIASTYAQTPAVTTPPVKNYSTDADLSRWVIDLNLLGGVAGQDFKTSSTFANYPNSLNANTGQLKFKNGYSFGGDADLGFFFGKKRHFGIGAGIMYMSQHGDAVLDNYHVEYQDKDGAGNTFRQVVTGNVKEEVVSSVFNIPLVFKYKNRFSKHWGFAADAGANINIGMRNTYTTHASFTNEAIYKFVNTGDGGTTSVYDNSPVPDVNDWMITKAEFLRNNPNGNLNDYFNAKRALGYKVGQGLEPANKTGKTSYNKGSIGLILQPSLNYFISDHVALNLGVYYMWQPYINDAKYGYRLTDGNGNYTSVLSSVTRSNNESYGINIGARFFLGKKHTAMSISSIQQTQPTQCGLCDGTILINGLPANQPVTVDYFLNGAQANKYATTVQPDGQVKLANLCAGNYTGIVARIKRENANGTPVTLADPAISISAQNASNPLTQGACDGSVKFEGLYAGRSVTINYQLNGSSQKEFTGVVNSDRSITIEHLCEGKYTGIMVTCNSCTAKGGDFTLAAPIPVKAPVVVTTVEKKGDITSTVLFEFDKSDINSSYYPVLDEAIREMKEDEFIYITVDGNADYIGTDGYNQRLSERRALAVKKYFIKKGVAPERMKMYAHGENKPVADNNTAEGRRQNRRVVMITSNKK